MMSQYFLPANVFSNMANGLNELIMPLQSDLAVSLRVFNTGAYQMSNLHTAFCQLRKLKINITSTAPADDQAWVDLRPSYALAKASNLQVLIIRKEDQETNGVRRGFGALNGVTSFAMLFHRCTFQDLRSLYLENITATDSQLQDFVLNTPSLQSLVIEAFALSSGLWVDVAEFVKSRRAHGLATVSLNKLRGGFIVDFRGHQWVRSICI